MDSSRHTNLQPPSAGQGPQGVAPKNRTRSVGRAKAPNFGSRSALYGFLGRAIPPHLPTSQGDAKRDGPESEGLQGGQHILEEQLHSDATVEPNSSAHCSSDEDDLPLGDRKVGTQELPLRVRKKTRKYGRILGIGQQVEVDKRRERDGGTVRLAERKTRRVEKKAGKEEDNVTQFFVPMSFKRKVQQAISAKPLPASATSGAANDRGEAKGEGEVARGPEEAQVVSSGDEVPSRAVEGSSSEAKESSAVRGKVGRTKKKKRSLGSEGRVEPDASGKVEAEDRARSNTEMLRERARLAARENAQLNAGRALHPFFALRQQGPEDPLIEGPSGQPNSSYRREELLPGPPYHVTQSVKEDATYHSSSSRWPMRRGRRTRPDEEDGLSPLLLPGLQPMLCKIMSLTGSISSSAYTAPEAARVAAPSGDAEQQALQGLCAYLKENEEEAKERDGADAAHCCAPTVEELTSRLASLRSRAMATGGEDSSMQNSANAPVKWETPVSLSAAWVDKYRPVSSREVCGNKRQVSELRDWMSEWSERAMQRTHVASKAAPADSSDSESDLAWSASIVDSEDDATGHPLLLTGPTGCGKTAAVYACANELGFHIIEINASDYRSGATIKQKFAEAMESHSVGRQIRSTCLPPLEASPSKAVENGPANEASSRVPIVLPRTRKTTGPPAAPTGYAPNNSGGSGWGGRRVPLVLFKDMDLLQEEDPGFQAAVSLMASKRRRPVILVTNARDPVLPKDLKQCAVGFQAPNAKELLAHITTVTLAEGILAPLSFLERCVRSCRQDIRRLLNTVQFWGQRPPPAARPPAQFGESESELNGGLFLSPSLPKDRQPGSGVGASPRGSTKPQQSDDRSRVDFLDSLTGTNGEPFLSAVLGGDEKRSEGGTLLRAPHAGSGAVLAQDCRALSRGPFFSREPELLAARLQPETSSQSTLSPFGKDPMVSGCLMEDLVVPDSEEAEVPEEEPAVQHRSEPPLSQAGQRLGSFPDTCPAGSAEGVPGAHDWPRDIQQLLEHNVQHNLAAQLFGHLSCPCQLLLGLAARIAAAQLAAEEASADAAAIHAERVAGREREEAGARAHARKHARKQAKEAKPSAQVGDKGGPLQGPWPAESPPSGVPKRRRKLTKASGIDGVDAFVPANGECLAQPMQEGREALKESSEAGVCAAGAHVSEGDKELEDRVLASSSGDLPERHLSGRRRRRGGSLKKSWATIPSSESEAGEDGDGAAGRAPLNGTAGAPPLPAGQERTTEDLAAAVGSHVAGFDPEAGGTGEMEGSAMRSSGPKPGGLRGACQETPSPAGVVELDEVNLFSSAPPPCPEVLPGVAQCSGAASPEGLPLGPLVGGPATDGLEGLVHFPELPPCRMGASPDVGSGEETGTAGVVGVDAPHPLGGLEAAIVAPVAGESSMELTGALGHREKEEQRGAGHDAMRGALQSGRVRAEGADSGDNAVVARQPDGVALDGPAGHSTCCTLPQEAAEATAIPCGLGPSGRVTEQAASVTDAVGGGEGGGACMGPPPHVQVAVSESGNKHASQGPYDGGAVDVFWAEAKGNSEAWRRLLTKSSIGARCMHHLDALACSFSDSDLLASRACGASSEESGFPGRNFRAPAAAEGAELGLMAGLEAAADVAAHVAHLGLAICRKGIHALPTPLTGSATWLEGDSRLLLAVSGNQTSLGSFLARGDFCSLPPLQMPLHRSPGAREQSMCSIRHAVAAFRPPSLSGVPCKTLLEYAGYIARLGQLEADGRHSTRRRSGQECYLSEDGVVKLLQHLSFGSRHFTKHQGQGDIGVEGIRTVT